MGKLSTTARDANHLRPQLFQEVFVWSSLYRRWLVARHDGNGIYTVDVQGKRKAVPQVRYWIPVPKLPE